MTTLQDYCIVKLMVTHGVNEQDARSLVSDEVNDWRKARIPFGWGGDIRRASEKTKAVAWYGVETRYQKGQEAK